jgi:tetratricopeptide (TPR) repeat protein
MNLIQKIVVVSCLALGLVLRSNVVVAQWWNYENDVQRDKNEMLLQNMGVQIDVGNAVNQMYNFKFADSEKQFRWFQVKAPNHPMPYFLLGLNEWWKIVPNTDNSMYDGKCMALMDSCIDHADDMFDRSEGEAKVEAAFFMSAAYAFKGRLYSERKKWTKAAWAGKNALKYLEYSKGKTNLNPELLFGDGLYNYYAQWIPKEYPSLKPILWFFSKGNKSLGIKQLEKTANQAFYTRIEARYFLLQIYAMEGMEDKCYEQAKYMHQVYPDNPYFHRYYARQAFVMGHTQVAEHEALDILEKINNIYPGYEATSGRYAAYILAYYNKHYKQNNEKAKMYYKMAVDFAKQNKASDSGYYLASQMELGEMAESAGEYAEAMAYYKDVEDKAERKSKQKEKAEEAIKDLKAKMKKAKKK